MCVAGAFLASALLALSPLASGAIISRDVGDMTIDGDMTDWGADVVKVEPPGGDPIRMFFATVGIEGQAVNPIFELDNRGKCGIVLDTAKDEGRQALLKLMVKHPILIERPIAVSNDRAALGRPPDNVLDVL